MTRRDVLVGCVMIMAAGNKPPAFTLHPAQRPDGVLLPIIECFTGHWLDPFARANSSLSLKTRDPSERELAHNTVDRTLYEWIQ